ncbi:long-chain-fatty-acid--CoA ligase FadD [Octadecabacter antarcticus 307]|uniref:Long-chain-fatty-acid--CoA ligase n=1 Tax=Octadecabacter antarcticus 307 TaxID=391626 RepID=M9RGZ3_9RHOB|nr:AMP-binding protein [Octadecabacter antarcticus]AGI69100.1 long-chain-fatty-acid--CoA ligase FadD [Octadecabacter antarcticus 307]
MSEQHKPWTAYYGPSVRKEIETAHYRTIGDMVSAVAHLYAKKPAFTTCLPNGMNGTLTFAQVDEMSNGLAVYLRETAGLEKGDRVALQVPNGLSFPVAAFAILKAGCVLVNVNPLYTAEEMARQFADAEPQALIVVDMFADKLTQALKGHPIPNIIITQVAEFFPAMPRSIVRLVQKHWDRTLAPIDLTHIRLPEAIEAGRQKSVSKEITVEAYREALLPDDIACLQYTGGTTGVSKGAMLTHKNLLMNMEQSMEMITGVEKGREVALTALPLYHIFAFTVNLLGFYYLGGRNILIPNPRPLTNLKRAMENYPITWMSGVNTLFNGLSNETWFQDSPPKHLKFASAGGMALQSSVAEVWEKVTGKPVLEGYGLTESSPVITFNPLGKMRPNSIGIPVPSTELRCLDEDGKDVPQGQPGELAARGPQIMKGYWKKPDDTAKIMQGDWLLTGDIGIMDKGGYFSIVDRKKDLVLVSGFNVYPNEIEDCLTRHPGILEAAVIGVPDGASGEAVKAFVVLSDQSLSSATIRAYCKEHLTGYKVPKMVEFRDDLPKSNVGKILRKDLRSEEFAPENGAQRNAS